MDVELSIVVPTWNRRALLEEAINSVTPLTICGSVEIIIADDGSSDGTTELVRQHRLAQDPDEKLKFVLSATLDRRGAQAARNRGLSIARGKWIMFLDSDDVIDPAGVATLVEQLQKDANLDYVYGRVLETDEQLEPLSGLRSIGAPFSDAPSEIAGWHWPVMGAIYRKSYLHRVGPWNEELTGSQDWEYQARVKLAGGKGVFMDTLVGYWRHHSGDRVGTTTFRADYSRSVMAACASILRCARLAGRCDSALEGRIAKRLMLHALECGANASMNQRRACFSQAINSLSNSWLLSTIAKFARVFPPIIDRWLWNALVSWRRRTNAGSP